MGSSLGEPGRPHAGSPLAPWTVTWAGAAGAVLGAPRVTPPTPQPRGSAGKPGIPSLAPVKGPLLVAWIDCWRSGLGRTQAPHPRPAGCLSRPDEPPVPLGRLCDSPRSRRRGPHSIHVFWSPGQREGMQGKVCLFERRPGTAGPPWARGGRPSRPAGGRRLAAARPPSPSRSPLRPGSREATHHSLHVGRRRVDLASQAVVQGDEEEALLLAQDWGGIQGQATWARPWVTAAR